MGEQNIQKQFRDNEYCSFPDDDRNFEKEPMDESEDEDTPEFRALCEKLEEEACRQEIEMEYESQHQLCGAIYEQVDEAMKENISNILEAMHQASRLRNERFLAVEQLIKRWIELIELGKKQKIEFGVPYYVFFEELSIMDLLVANSHWLRKCKLFTHEKYQLDLLLSEISDLVSTGTYVGDGVLRFLPTSLLKEHNSYLLSLKQIVCDSIESDKKDGVIVERDNAFYCVQCPEESVVTPAKFMNSPEFKDLEYGALKIGEGDDIIRIRNGQYYDMKGVLQMTFPVGEEKIEMILSSENASSFGKITVHMDGKNREIFSQYCGELEKESRISEIVEAAKSFVQNKAPPLSSMDNTNTQHLQSSGQASPAH